MSLALKAVKYKHYNDLQFLIITTQYWKDVSKDFESSLVLSTNKKREAFESMLVIID